MKVVYIAGPFRAATPWLIEQNVRAAETVALEVWRMGAAALCPHMNTRHFQDCAPDAVWIEGTLELLRRCDAVLVQGNWMMSTGTRGEIDEARKLEKPVFFNTTELRWWIEEKAGRQS
jgi:nucleoside 2-deoxyribosyltransferase